MKLEMQISAHTHVSSFEQEAYLRRLHHDQKKDESTEKLDC